MEGVGAAAAAAKRVEAVVEERLSESLRENGEAAAAHLSVTVAHVALRNR